MDTANILMQAFVNAIVQEVLKSEPIRLLVKATQDLHQAAGSKLLTNAADVTELVKRIEALESTIPTPSVETLAQYVLTHSAFIEGTKQIVTSATGESINNMMDSVRSAKTEQLAQQVFNHAGFQQLTKMLVDETLSNVGDNEIVQRAVGAYLDNTNTLQERVESILTDGRNDTISDAVQACINNGTFLEEAIDKHLDNSDAVEDAVKGFLSNANVSVSVG